MHGYARAMRPTCRIGAHGIPAGKDPGRIDMRAIAPMKAGELSGISRTSL
jgi:hypothetical protein